MDQKDFKTTEYHIGHDYKFWKFNISGNKKKEMLFSLNLSKQTVNKFIKT